MSPQPFHSALSLQNVKNVKNLIIDVLDKCRLDLKKVVENYKKKPLKSTNSAPDQCVLKDINKHKLYSGLYELVTFFAYIRKNKIHSNQSST